MADRLSLLLYGLSAREPGLWFGLPERPARKGLSDRCGPILGAGVPLGAGAVPVCEKSIRFIGEKSRSPSGLVIILGKVGAGE